jgi:hypothetical protein
MGILPVRFPITQMDESTGRSYDGASPHTLTIVQPVKKFINNP